MAMGLEEKYDVILPQLAGVSGQAREHCLGHFGGSSPWKLTSGESVIRKKGAYIHEEKKL